MKYNQYIHYNEKNWGLARLRDKYPNESEDKIYERFFGRKLKEPKKERNHAK